MHNLILARALLVGAAQIVVKEIPILSLGVITAEPRDSFLKSEEGNSD
jgi:hypothetical protein